MSNGSTSARTRVHGKLLKILEMSPKMNSVRETSALLELMAQEATQLMEADRASIFLLDRERCELRSSVALGNEAMLCFDARLGIAGAAAMTGQVINVENAQEDQRFYSHIDDRFGYQTRSVLAVPMRNQKGEIIGTFEVLNKVQGPFDDEDEKILVALASHAATAVETAELFEKLQAENTQLRREVESTFATQSLVGTSSQIQRVVRLIDTISDSKVSVLITGESGTGKELVAKAIHHSSSRSNRPFIPVNSAALPENLLESELFGIEKGVATGVERRIGKFEEADGGTLFLDEIGDLSPTAQAKILRALQEQVIERIGGRKPIPVDVRILAATNKDLEKAIEEGDFREDLYYRLNVVHIEMPCLRETRQDVPLLANHFLARFARESGKEPKQLASDALRRLTEYNWPGNVRQLENEMKRLQVSVRSQVIRAADLAVGSPDRLPRISDRIPKKGSMKEMVASLVEELERQLINEALEKSNRNQQQAARVLGLSRQGLIKKMKRYGMK
ncbi:MAG: sigma 54-interacting transcriptional regulator [Acidobacteriota bacterium]